jgi:TonB family protein
LGNSATAIAFDVNESRHLSLAYPPALKPPPDPLKKALLLSIGGHVVVAFAFIAGSFFSDSAEAVAPLEIDVTFVELSALETQLPKSGGEAAPSVSPVVSKPEEEKPIAVAPKKLKVEKRQIDEKPRSSSQSPQTQPAESSAGVGGGQSVPNGVANGVDGLEKARLNYQDMVATMLARAKRYPERAVRNRTTGNGTLRVKINPQGEVLSAEVVNSTQSTILDEELQRMVDRAAPFPAFPPDMGMSQVALLVPVSFRLEN